MPCCRPKRLAPLQQAVILVRNAYHGRPPASPTPWSMAARRIYHHKLYRLVSAAAALTLCGLGFAEPAMSDQPYPSAAVPILEVLCLLFFGTDCALQFIYLGPSIFVTKKWTVVKTFLVPLNLLSMLVVYISAQWGWGLVRLFRPVFLLERFRNVRRIAASIISATPRILSVAAMLGMANVLYGVLGFVLFAGIDGEQCSAFRGKPRPPSGCSTFLSPAEGGCQDYFASLLDSMTQLFILTTTANFPGVMLPAYRCSRWYAAFFVTYILLSTFFLLNLTLAATYLAFKGLTQRKVLARYSNMFDGVDLAFSKLAALTDRHGDAPTEPKVALSPLAPPAASSVASPLSLPPAAAGPAATPPAKPTPATPSPPPPPPPLALSSSPAGSAAIRLAPYKPRERTFAGVSSAVWRDFFCALHPRTPPRAADLLFLSVDGDGRGLVFGMEFRRMVVFFGRLKIREPARGRGIRSKLARSVRAIAGAMGRGPCPPGAGDGQARDAAAAGADAGRRVSFAPGTAPPGVVRRRGAASGTADGVPSAAAGARPRGQSVIAPPSCSQRCRRVGRFLLKPIDDPALGGGAASRGRAEDAAPWGTDGGGGSAAGGSAAGAETPASPVLDWGGRSPPAPGASPVDRPSSRRQRAGLAALDRSVSDSSVGAEPVDDSDSGGSDDSDDDDGDSAGSAARRTEYRCCLLGSAPCSASDPINAVPSSAARARRAASPRASPAACCGRWRRAARALVRVRLVAWFFDVAVVVNALAVLAELALTPSTGAATTSSAEVRPVEALQYTTLAIFLLEVALKAWALGLGRYLRSSFHRIDFVLAVAAVAGTILEVAVLRDDTEAQWSSAITFMRSLRILRPLRTIAGFGTTVRAFMDTLPVLGQYVTVLAAVFYGFAVLGVRLFAGQLRRDDPAVQASSYGKHEYWAYNFDDLGSAMTSLFSLMVVNDWPVLMEGCEAGTGTPWARAFFVTFYLVTVVLVLNVLVAFIIESFALQKARIDRDEAEREARDRGAGAARLKRRSVGEASRWRRRMLEADTNDIGDGPSGSWAGVEAAATAALGADDRLGAVAGEPGAVDALISSSGWKALPAGEEWRLMLARAGLSLGGFRARSARSPFDIYDSLYRDAIHAEFPRTFSTQRRGGNANGQP